MMLEGIEFRFGLGPLTLEGLLPLQPLINGWNRLKARNEQARRLDAMSPYQVPTQCAKCSASILFLSVVRLDDGVWRYCRKCDTHFR